MTIKIRGPFGTIATLYQGIKDTFTAHGGWTNNTDTPVSGSAFTLEYTSAVTIDGEAIKVHLETNASGYPIAGVYDSTNTLKSFTGTSTMASRGCYVMVGDDFVIVTQNAYGTANGPMIAGNLIDYANKAGFTGADLLCYGLLESDLNLYRARSRNDTGTVLSGSFSFYPNYYQFINNTTVENGTFQTLFPAYCSLYTSTVAGSNGYGYAGVLKSGIFYTGNQTINYDSTGTVNGHLYRRISSSSSIDNRSGLFVKWEEVA